LANTILGNGAANTIAGGGGNDTLKGYAGADTFVFNTLLDAKQNVDTIADFAVGQDRIALDGAIFRALDLGSLKASDFVIGKLAATADQNVIYDSGTGKLFYDADGAGGAAQVQFASLSPGLKLAADSFIIL
ncbi:M10 family metallopeptidase C-terminal domain-containing protein, partial [Aureimonas leprariae]